MLGRILLNYEKQGKSIFGYKLSKNRYLSSTKQTLIIHKSANITKNTSHHLNSSKTKQNKSDKCQIKNEQKIGVVHLSQQITPQHDVSQKKRRMKKIRSNQMEDYLRDFRALKQTQNNNQYHDKFVYSRQISKYSPAQNHSSQHQSQTKKSLKFIYNQLLKDISLKKWSKKLVSSRKWIFQSSSIYHQGVILINIGQQNYSKINQPIINQINTNTDIQLRTILKLLSNFSTTLQDNIYYCVFGLTQNLLHQLRTDYLSDDPHIRLFIINRPINHQQRLDAQKLIKDFVIKNKLILNQGQNVQNKRSLYNQLILVVDHRGCVSVIGYKQGENILNRIPKKQASSLNQKISQNKSKQVFIEILIQKIIKSCKVCLNLDLAYLNCLFGKDNGSINIDDSNLLHN